MTPEELQGKLQARELSRAEAELEVWLGVRELLGEKKRWTKNASAKNAYGVPVRATSENAICWCLAGAVKKVVGEAYLPLRLKNFGMEVDYIIWNDRKETTHKDVLRYLDERLLLAREAVEKADE